ncbi:hypothetical protein EVAR_20527_1 [Eumeta japonica]|uniref:Uncharacterized protein n=1 Tax=Eumeta variegata TaxID=151549 RepID=A0A4C1VKY1_EUMVA|nr:hypothetical protein EVAR_20527_1 [Eumeta japonica]
MHIKIFVLLLTASACLCMHLGLNADVFRERYNEDESVQKNSFRIIDSAPVRTDAHIQNEKDNVSADKVINSRIKRSSVGVGCPTGYQRTEIGSEKISHTPKYLEANEDYLYPFCFKKRRVMAEATTMRCDVSQTNGPLFTTSSSNRDSDEDEKTDKDKDEKLDDSQKAKLLSFNYHGGHNIDTTEPLGDGDFLETQELDYGNYFDDPRHADYKKSRVTSKEFISKVETVDTVVSNSRSSLDERKQAIMFW